MYSWFYSYTLLNVCFKIGTFARHACIVLALGRTEFFFWWLRIRRLTESANLYAHLLWQSSQPCLTVLQLLVGGCCIHFCELFTTNPSVLFQSLSRGDQVCQRQHTSTAPPLLVNLQKWTWNGHKIGIVIKWMYSGSFTHWGFLCVCQKVVWVATLCLRLPYNNQWKVVKLSSWALLFPWMLAKRSCSVSAGVRLALCVGRSLGLLICLMLLRGGTACYELWARCSLWLLNNKQWSVLPLP